MISSDESDQKLRVASVQAIERLLRAAPRDADRLTLQRFVARYIGRNPNAIEPLNPDSAIVAQRDRAQAMVADLKAKLADAAQRSIALERDLRDTKAQLKVAQSERAKMQRKVARKASAAPVQPRDVKGKPDRNTYMREYMRRKRSESRSVPVAADAA